eukprot:Hpha_TRINITY_DN18971_c0_g1::TRINITY_DN18971_c0_g1_i1::g.17651::m.17651/K07964/HPSE; heparanase
MLRCLLLAGPVAVLTAPVDVVDVSVGSTVLYKTEKTYASWNIDSSCNRGFHRTNFSNPNLVWAARGLSPSVLRFGGSGNDNLVYGLTPGSPQCAGITPAPPPQHPGCDYVTPGCLNATHWNSLYNLAKESSTEFLFGVAFGLEAACKEGTAYVWNATNAGELLDYLKANGQKLWGFELGNEVNNNGGAPCNQTAAQQAEAYLRFHDMIADKAAGSVLVGPDTGYRQAEDWLKDFLPRVAAKPGLLHAVTHHVYAGISRTNFDSIKELDGSAAEIAWYSQVVGDLAPGAGMWAGEDGPIGGGDDGTCGENAACGTYATTLWYADDMARRARAGFSQYQRQDLWGGAYGLTNSATGVQALDGEEAVFLRPDYWVNFLWKRTVGTGVLNASSSADALRAYAFSGPAPSSWRDAECAKASRTLILINTNTTTISVNLPAGPAPGGEYQAWSLTAETPFSLRTLLNGKELPASADASSTDPATFLSAIPVPANRGAADRPLSLPPVSTTFVCY